MPYALSTMLKRIFWSLFYRICWFWW